MYASFNPNEMFNALIYSASLVDRTLYMAVDVNPKALNSLLTAT